MDNPGTANTGAALTNTGPETPDITVSTARPQDTLRRQIEAPLHRIFERIDGTAGVVVIGGMAKSRPPRVGYFRPDQPEAMLDFVAENEHQQLNSYVYYGLRRPGLRPGATGAKTDVPSTIAVVVDIDDPEAAALAEERLRALGVAPTYVLETSRTPHRRFQIAWLFRTPETNFRLWLAVATKLRDIFGADRIIIDIAHCWRIPGTTNFPDAAKAAAGRIVEPSILIAADWDRRYTLDELAVGLDVHVPPPSNDDDPSPRPPAAEANADWIALLSSLPPEASRQVERPTPKGDGSRSSQDYWLIGRLRERGFTFEQVVQLFAGGAARRMVFAARYAEEDETRAQRRGARVPAHDLGQSGPSAGAARSDYQHEHVS